MTKKVLLLTAFSTLTYLTLVSNKTGPATNGQGNKTGGPGSSGQTCSIAGCHSSGIGTTTGSFEVRKKFQPDSNAVVNSYLPDSLYSVKLIGSHTTLNKFGFQLSALKINDSSNAGTFSNLSPKVQATTAGGRNLLEHTDTMSKAGGGFEMSFTWKAPAKNSGQIRFYGIINAVNGDGASTGDKPSNTIMLALAESLNIPNTDNKKQLIIFPNPVNNVLNLEHKNAENGIYYITVYNAAGQKIVSEQITVKANAITHSVNTSQWNTGLYIIHLSHNSKEEVATVIKQ